MYKKKIHFVLKYLNTFNSLMQGAVVKKDVDFTACGYLYC